MGMPGTPFRYTNAPYISALVVGRNQPKSRNIKNKTENRGLPPAVPQLAVFLVCVCHINEVLVFSRSGINNLEWTKSTTRNGQ